MKKAIKTPILSVLGCILIGLVGLGSLRAAPPTMPLISRNCPVFASNGTATGANDANYGTTWRGTVPGWIAYDLSAIPKVQRSQVIIAWYNPDTYDYDFTVKNNWAYGILKTYTIEGNAAPGASTPPTSGWVPLATVSGNTYHSRQHLLNITGYNWIRLNISAANGSGDTSGVSINLDIHDASYGADDSWIFYGDSITAGGMVVSGDNSFAQMVNLSKPEFYPAAECGGIGGIFSTQGAQNIDKWLSVFPGKYVGISFGTNDAWGNQTGATNFYNNLETMVKAVLAAGKVPIIPTIPWSTLTDINTHAPSYNSQIKALYAAYPQIVKGPDLWSFFKNNPHYLSSDGVHPSSEGYIAMRQYWVDTMLAVIYNNSSPAVTPSATVSPSPTITIPVSPSPSLSVSPSISPSVEPSASPTPSPGANYSVQYIQNDWGSGATVNITIKNNSTQPVNGWTLTWTFSGNQKITNLWCGSFTQNGAAVSVKNADYNGTIPAGGTVNFGFNLSYSGTNLKPTGFTLNKIACEVR